MSGIEYNNIFAIFEVDLMRYRIIIEQDEDGIFVVEAPSLPGCISQGKTRDEALNNIKEAIEAYLETLREHKEGTISFS